MCYLILPTLFQHHYVNNSIDATAVSMNAGVNLELGGTVLTNQLQALKQGEWETVTTHTRTHTRTHTHITFHSALYDVNDSILKPNPKT